MSLKLSTPQPTHASLSRDQYVANKCRKIGIKNEDFILKRKKRECLEYLIQQCRKNKQNHAMCFFFCSRKKTTGPFEPKHIHPPCFSGSIHCFEEKKKRTTPAVDRQKAKTYLLMKTNSVNGSNAAAAVAVLIFSSRRLAARASGSGEASFRPRSCARRRGRSRGSWR